MNVLFIEDDKIQLVKLKKAIEDLGISHSINILESGIDAISDFRTRDVSMDLIVVDLNMPQMDGLSFIKNMKASRYRPIPIVVFTTSRFMDDILECYRSGAASYVYKPSDYGEYKNTLKTLFNYWELNLYSNAMQKGQLEINKNEY